MEVNWPDRSPQKRESNDGMLMRELHGMYADSSSVFEIGSSWPICPER